MSLKQDNSTLDFKVSLRRKLLEQMDDTPVVLETHGGYGEIYRKCYSSVRSGMVFEQDPEKTNVLCVQRPSWMVYETDSLAALQNNIQKNISFNFIDLDPYGEPWPYLIALFADSNHISSDTIAIAVNDGLRQKLKMNGAWCVKSMQDTVAKYGNSALYKQYKELCSEMLQDIVGKAGFKIKKWAAYYCGYAAMMTHYGAIIKRP